MQQGQTVHRSKVIDKTIRTDRPKTEANKNKQTNIYIIYRQNDIQIGKRKKVCKTTQKIIL